MEREERLEYMTTVLKALAHPTRLLIVEELAECDHCVQDLQSKIDANMSTVSRHLKVLRDAGIVDSRKELNQVYYKLIYPCVFNIFNCILNARENKGTCGGEDERKIERT